ncbi:phosphoribosyltransferase family protein, partial [Micrococcus luteus]|uniref:phosphoribosyltransferase family protein n=1 Tax=Micrococcus luteus TaxID=1270 RepID=UPI0033F35998
EPVGRGRGQVEAGAAVPDEHLRDDAAAVVLTGRLPAGAPVLLVDDVLTTGATLAALAEAVRRAGGHPVGAVVLAAVAPPRDPAEPGPRPGPRVG